MHLKREIIVSDDWFRCGRGHSFSFYATPEEIQPLVFEAIDSTFDDYYICGTHSKNIENTRNFEQVGFFYPIKEIVQCLHDNKSNLNFCIGFEDLTPSKDIVALNSSAFMSLNGLVLLQYFTTPNAKTSRIPASNIGIVSKIYNRTTDEIVSHDAYFQIYNKLKKVFRKKLPYRTLFVCQNGNDSWEDKSCRMSEAIVQRYKNGRLYQHKPYLERSL